MQREKENDNLVSVFMHLMMQVQYQLMYKRYYLASNISAKKSFSNTQHGTTIQTSSHCTSAFNLFLFF